MSKLSSCCRTVVLLEVEVAAVVWVALLKEGTEVEVLEKDPSLLFGVVPILTTLEAPFVTGNDAVAAGGLSLMLLLLGCWIHPCRPCCCFPLMFFFSLLVAEVEEAVMVDVDVAAVAIGVLNEQLRHILIFLPLPLLVLLQFTTTIGPCWRGVHGLRCTKMARRPSVGRSSKA